MKVCINCDAVNDLDAVFCSKCGMSLMGAPTDGEAMKLADKRRAERQRRLEQPLTPAGIVYLFGDWFARRPVPAPIAIARTAILMGLAIVSLAPSVLEPESLRVPHSGQQVAVRDLARRLLEAAFVFLAQEGYISLGVDKATNLFSSGQAVTIGQQKSGDSLPRSLERSIMDALPSPPQVTWLRTLVAGLPKRRSYSVAAVDIVADALMEMGWLYIGLPTNEAAPLLVAMAGEAETVKARLETFAAANPHLHRMLVKDAGAGVRGYFPIPWW